jgi:hypothetical protein
VRILLARRERMTIDAAQVAPLIGAKNSTRVQGIGAPGKWFAAAVCLHVTGW